MYSNEHLNFQNKSEAVVLHFNFQNKSERKEDNERSGDVRVQGKHRGNEQTGLSPTLAGVPPPWGVLACVRVRACMRLSNGNVMV